MRVEISDGVTWRDLGGDVVILNVETGVYFGLDGSGGQIWRELVEHGSIEKSKQRNAILTSFAESGVLASFELVSEQVASFEKQSRLFWLEAGIVRRNTLRSLLYPHQRVCIAFAVLMDGLWNTQGQRSQFALAICCRIKRAFDIPLGELRTIFLPSADHPTMKRLTLHIMATYWKIRERRGEEIPAHKRERGSVMGFHAGLVI